MTIKRAHFMTPSPSVPRSDLQHAHQSALGQRRLVLAADEQAVGGRQRKQIGRAFPRQKADGGELVARTRPPLRLGPDDGLVELAWPIGPKAGVYLARD